jgi:hypothetical protein
MDIFKKKEKDKKEKKEEKNYKPPKIEPSKLKSFLNNYKGMKGGSNNKLHLIKDKLTKIKILYPELYYFNNGLNIEEKLDNYLMNNNNSSIDELLIEVKSLILI